MQATLYTERLSLIPMTTDDSAFIIELLNSEGWIRYIGDRKVHTTEDAIRYIESITSKSFLQYWVVRLQQTPIGIATILRRDFLPGPDLGFAFLPAYSGQGYAYEAVSAIMQQAPERPLYAIVLPENAASIKLLRRLGFAFARTREEEGEPEHVYVAASL